MITLVAWTEYDPSGQIGPSFELGIDARDDEGIKAAKLLADLLVKDRFVSVMLFDENDNEIYDAK
jgi:hypothetical protein